MIAETTMDARERRAADLAALIDERGHARFPRDAGGLTGEALKQARRDLFQAIEDLADAGREVEVCDLDFDASTVLWFADSPPDDPE